jgi:hypothetical protein
LNECDADLIIQMKAKDLLETSLVLKRVFRQMNSLDVKLLILPNKQKQSQDFKDLTVPRAYPLTLTLGGVKRTSRPMTMGIWSLLPRILYADSVSLPGMTWKI